MKVRLLVAMVVVLAMMGCATVTVDRVTGVADSGSSYVKTMKKVNEFALNESIRFTADMLADTQPPARDIDILNAQTAEMKKRVSLVGSANEYFDGIAEYFAELEALAKGDQSEATEKALGQVVNSLQNEPVNLKITDDRKKALTGLAGYVAKQMHAAAVEKALVRDADIVAQSLALSDAMLDEEIRWVKVRAEAELKKTYVEKVETPYKKGEKLDNDWKKAWSEYVKGPPAIALLDEAKKASKDMQAAWINILRGKYSFTEIQVSLKNVKDGLDAANALKNSK